MELTFNPRARHEDDAVVLTLTDHPTGSVVTVTQWHSGAIDITTDAVEVPKADEVDYILRLCRRNPADYNLVLAGSVWQATPKEHTL